MVSLIFYNIFFNSIYMQAIPFILVLIFTIYKHLKKREVMCQSEIASYLNSKLDGNKKIDTSAYEKSLDKTVLDSIPSIDGNSFTYVLGRAENVHGGQHWVVLEGLLKAGECGSCDTRNGA